MTYDFQIVAQTGGGGATPFTEILTHGSINKDGDVAFVGKTSEGQAIYVVDGSDSPSPIPEPRKVSFQDLDRSFVGEIQINDKDKIAAIDRTTLFNTFSLARVWDANTPDQWDIVARSISPRPHIPLYCIPVLGGCIPIGSQPDPNYDDYFDSIFSGASISNDNQVAFTALYGEEENNFKFGEEHVQLHLANTSDYLEDPNSPPPSSTNEKVVDASENTQLQNLKPPAKQPQIFSVLRVF